MPHATIRNLSSPRSYNTINFQHLHCALVAADHSSIRSAAETLMIQQSTLSRYIRQLEHTIGVPVFDRYSGGVRATEFGQGFLRAARSILEQIDGVVLSGHLAGCGKSGRLSIGFYTSLSAGNLRSTLVEYAQQFPQIEIAVRIRRRPRLGPFWLEADRA